MVYVDLKGDEAHVKELDPHCLGYSLWYYTHSTSQLSRQFLPTKLFQTSL